MPEFGHIPNQHSVAYKRLNAQLCVIAQLYILKREPLAGQPMPKQKHKVDVAAGGWGSKVDSLRKHHIYTQCYLTFRGTHEMKTLVSTCIHHARRHNIGDDVNIIPEGPMQAPCLHLHHRRTSTVLQMTVNLPPWDTSSRIRDRVWAVVVEPQLKNEHLERRWEPRGNIGEDAETHPKGAIGSYDTMKG